MRIFLEKIIKKKLFYSVFSLFLLSLLVSCQSSSAFLVNKSKIEEVKKVAIVSFYSNYLIVEPDNFDILVDLFGVESKELDKQKQNVTNMINDYYNLLSEKLSEEFEVIGNEEVIKKKAYQGFGNSTEESNEIALIASLEEEESRSLTAKELEVDKNR